MRPRIRKLVRALQWLSLALLLTSGIGLYFIRTAAFQNRVRDGIVSALENASGGRVELRTFAFDWRTFSARFDDLTIHGTEPADAQPLLHAPSLRIDLKLVSLFAHDVDVVRIVAEHPAINLLIHPDGSSNLPDPAKVSANAIDDFFNLKIDHFDLEHGSLQVNAARHAFTLHGNDLRALLKRQGVKDAFGLTIASSKVDIRADCCRNLLLSIRAEATLRRDMVQVEKALIASEGATLEASGNISHFLQPAAAFRFHAEGPADVIARLTSISGLRRGALSLTGVAHYNAENGFAAEGAAEARGIAYSSPRFSVEHVHATSRFSFSKNTATFRDAVVRALSGKITGQIDVRHGRVENVNAALISLDLRQLALAVRDKTFPWSGFVNGNLYGGSAAGYNGEAVIRPGPGTNPLSGQVKFSGGSLADVQFGESHLAARHTQLTFEGSRKTGLDLTLESTDLADIQPALTFLNMGANVRVLPLIHQGGSARFSGNLGGSLTQPIIHGNLSLSNFEYAKHQWDRIMWRGTFSPATLIAESLALDAGSLHLAGTGQVGLQNGTVTKDSALQFAGSAKGVALSMLSLPVTQGTLSATLDVSGTLDHPAAQAQITAEHLEIARQKFSRAEARVKLAHDEIQFDKGRAEGEQGGALSFQASYAHSKDEWRHGVLSAAVQSRQLAFSNLAFTQSSAAGLSGQVDSDTRFSATLVPGGFQVEQASGNLTLKHVALSGEPLGNLQAQLHTHNQTLQILLAGNLRGNDLTGKAAIDLTAGNSVQGDLKFERIPLSTLQNLLTPATSRMPAINGFAKGSIQFAGLLSQFGDWRSTIQLEQLQLDAPVPNGAPPFELHNAQPVAITLADGVASFPDTELLGPDTKMHVQGSLGYVHNRRPLKIAASGSVGLGVLSLFNPTLQSAGQSNIAAAIGGTLDAPSVSGKVELKNGSISLRDAPNSLSQLNGLVTFDRDRATIQTLTAEYGGGHLKAGGFISFAGNAPLAYHLDAHAEETRFRNASGISMTASADVRLSGTSSSSLLSGTATISRIVFNPSTDVGNVLSSFNASAPSTAERGSFLGTMQLDVAIQNAPNLQLSTALSRDVEADVDLHLRGTPDRPVLLGAIDVNQGDIRVFGSRYSINRGEVSFLNAARIEPVLDLDLQTEARGINVDITISGTLNRLNITYRSDPPLQPRDIIALLTVGRTPEQSSNVQSTQATDTPSLQSGASSVLGQAISPQSSRLAKLFGITNIKIDPLVQGITNIRQSRLTLEQQISRNITITYVTNLEQTSEQIFRLEWAINRQYSVVAVRDDNGEFGIDIQYRKRFK